MGGSGMVICDDFGWDCSMEIYMELWQHFRCFEGLGLDWKRGELEEFLF